MTFERFLEVKIGGLTLALWLLAWVLGMMLSREKSMQRRIDRLIDEFRDMKPTDRLPSTREKRKMKWCQREIRGVENELAALVKNKLVLDLTFIGVFVVLGIFLIPGRVIIGVSVLIVTLMIANLIFNTVGNNWTSRAITAYFLMGLTVILLIGFGASKTMATIHEVAEMGEITEPSETTAPAKTPEMPGTSDPQNPEPNDVTDDLVSNELVEAILRDTEDAYYNKHLTELTPYTDKFGIDLDKLLGDYGYQFVAYDVADDVGIPTLQLPATKSYWLVFSTGDGFVLIHTCGGRAICASGDDEYLMMPSLYDVPDIEVSLHEKNFAVNRKVVALIMEFLDGQPKLTPRNASGVVEFKV